MEDHGKILDRHIGRKIRERRKVLGLTQGELADILEISHQQVQRYESGENTLSAARLLEIAQGMNVGLDYFYVDAPLARTVGKKIDSGIIARRADRVLRVLLVEDSASDELLFRKAVEKSGVAAEVHAIQKPETVAAYLLECGKAHAAARPDLILMDINMPKLNGLNLLKQIKSHPALRALPVIMLTNSVRSKDMNDSYAMQASGFLQKNSDLFGFFQDVELMLRYWSQLVILPMFTGESHAEPAAERAF